MSREPETLELAMILGNRLVERVQTNPVSTLAGAAGVGYVLARGLPSVVLRMGATVAVRALTTRLIAELAPPAEATSAPAPASAPTTPSHSDSGTVEAASSSTSPSDASGAKGATRDRPGGRTAVVVG